MNRRDLLTGLAASGAVSALNACSGASRPTQRVVLGPHVAISDPVARAVVEITETDWEVRPGLRLRTKVYGGRIPGPLLRFPDGQRVAITVRNRSSEKQTVHWHGLIVPDSVDGGVETGTEPVAPGAEHTYAFTVSPGGTRWYHSHYGEGLFSGMFGPLIVDRRDERGDYDREVVLVLHEFKHHIPSQGAMAESRPAGSPYLSAPAMSMSHMLRRGGMMGGAMQNSGGMMNGMTSGGMLGPNMAMHDARYAAYAINGKALGAGEPIRVKRGERVRLRIINASATLTHRLALPGHQFLVTELDGNPVPHPRLLDALEVGVAERVDAIVTMDHPGVWVLGSTVQNARENGMGIVVEYAGARGVPVWRDDARDPFAYALFAAAGNAVDVARTFTLVLRKSPRDSNGWSINGRRFPNTEQLAVQPGAAYRVRFVNMSMMEHPMHVHGHRFELLGVNGESMNSVRKDTVVVPPMMGRVDLLLRADNPWHGRFLLHCHNQQHMDGGMTTVLIYD